MAAALCFVLKLLDYKEAEYDRALSALSSHYEDALDITPLSPPIHLPYNKNSGTCFTAVAAKLKDGLDGALNFKCSNYQ